MNEPVLACDFWVQSTVAAGAPGSGAAAGHAVAIESHTFDSEGNLVVADFVSHRVQVMCYHDGTHLCTIGSEESEDSGNGQLYCPLDGRIVVADFGKHRVQVLE